MNIKPKIIIDTDPGHDDALALMLIIKSGYFDVLAITTVAGNSTIQHVTRNAQAILNLIDNRTKIYSGCAQPLKRPLVQAVVHGESGIDGFDTTQTEYGLTDNASQKIVDIIRNNPGEVTLLTLGPLSNIARAFQLDPDLPKLIPQIIMMGGAITVPGNKNRVAEFNFFVDPEAANIVFSSSIPKVLVPLDACNQVILQLNDFQKIKNVQLKPVLLSMMEKFIQGLSDDEGVAGVLVYDALAAYYLLNPQAFSLEEMDILIETKGEHTGGMTIAEKRDYKSQKPNAKVVTQVNDQIFKKDFIQILSQ